MSRISQVPIPRVTPEEALTPALFNQIIRGANNARQITGADGVDVTNIGGMVGITGTPPFNGNRAVSVYVDTRTSYGPGMWAGRMYMQEYQTAQVKQKDGTNAIVHENKEPLPNVQTCMVIDSLAYNQRHAPSPFNPPNLSSSPFVTNGILIGYASNGLPLVQIQNANGLQLLLTPNGTTSIGSTVTLAGGAYAAKTIIPLANTGTITLTGTTLGLSTFGTANASSNAYFVNLPEVGQTTHDLVSTANTATVCAAIYVNGIAPDGYPVYSGVLVFPGCS